MQRRLAIVGFVFVVGFGLGYGTTWLLAGSPGVLDAPPPPPAETAAATPPPAAPAPAPAAAIPVAPAAPVIAVVDAGSAEAPDVVEPAEVTPDPDVVVAAADVGPSPAAPASPPPSHPCVGRTCRLDALNVKGGLPVRNGTLTDGSQVEWARDFGAGSIQGHIPLNATIKVEVRAVGFKDGMPIAAAIVYRNRGKVLSGVISLAIGSKQLSLVPE